MKPHSRPRERRLTQLVLACGMVVLMVSGCQQPQRRYKPASLATRSDVARYVQEALEADSADARRAAVDQIAKTYHAGLPMVIDAIALVARTDESSSVRCAAVRALGAQDDPKSVDTMVILLSQSEGNSSVRSAGAAVRWEAMKSLCKRLMGEPLPDATLRHVRAAAIDRLNRDPSRDVRIAAATLLGYDADGMCVTALVDALRQADFGVQYEAERSLMRLTGITHDHNPTRWQAWLDSTAEPFAGRGALDRQLDGKKGIWPFGGA